MIKIDTYRVRTDKWHRTWQAEWDTCLFACRAYTKTGVTWKALRWHRRGIDVRQYLKARQKEQNA